MPSCLLAMMLSLELVLAMDRRGAANLITPEDEKTDHSCNRSKVRVVKQGRTPRMKSSRSASKEIIIIIIIFPFVYAELAQIIAQLGKVVL